MHNQTTTIEQSRRLLELGVPAERASMCWVKDSNEGEYSLCLHDEFCYEVAALEPVPAFTVADLLGMMPKFVWDDVKRSCRLNIIYSNDEKPVIGYDGPVGNLMYWRDGSLLDNLISAIKWLLSNGYKLEV